MTLSALSCMSGSTWECVSIVMEMREMVGWLARSVPHSGKEPQTTLSKGSSRKESPELDAFFSGLPVALLYSTLRRPFSESAQEEPLLTTPQGRIEVVRDVDPTSTASANGVDLPVGSLLARVGYLARFTREGRLHLLRHRKQRHQACHQHPSRQGP